jgi:hypothetical protein
VASTATRESDNIPSRGELLAERTRRDPLGRYLPLGSAPTITSPAADRVVRSRAFLSYSGWNLVRDALSNASRRGCQRENAADENITSRAEGGIG